MSFVIGFLTFVLVMNCLVLMLLILIQLPKKEAGIGTAFGGSATDALFGAGTGNALTKMTKYATTLFIVLSIGLSMLSVRATRRGESGLREALQKQATKATAPMTPTPPAPGSSAPLVTSGLLSNLSLTTASNAPAAKPVPGAPPANQTSAPPKKP
ncbi:MAG: preprotein translocase subunit SecG [Verrucomicrobia bacterium]|nr:preprotein translocase subunit SecG [Verrucomicrobiota bacterium]